MQVNEIRIPSIVKPTYEITKDRAVVSLLETGKSYIKQHAELIIEILDDKGRHVVYMAEIVLNSDLGGPWFNQTATVSVECTKNFPQKLLKPPKNKPAWFNSTYIGKYQKCPSTSYYVSDVGAKNMIKDILTKKSVLILGKRFCFIKWQVKALCFGITAVTVV